jgi:hypothetical protein
MIIPKVFLVLYILCIYIYIHIPGCLIVMTFTRNYTFETTYMNNHSELSIIVLNNVEIFSFS